MAPQPAVPPSLPPSVEEAYRRKCVQLRNRTNEVEDANDAACLRLARIKRQVEKLRIERAFLLEQLAKRTSTNVEDSEGSPSLPPTPKDKPLRIKRGHRKSAADAEPSSKPGTAASAKEPASPTSESQSHPAKGTKATAADAKSSSLSSANGLSKPSKKTPTGFDLYCEETRPILEAKAKSSDINIDDELVRGWEKLRGPDKSYWRAMAERMARRQQQETEAKEAKNADDSGKKEAKPAGAGKPETHDDVDIVTYNTDD